MKLFFIDNGVGYLIHVGSDEDTPETVAPKFGEEATATELQPAELQPAELQPAETPNTFYIDIEHEMILDVSWVSRRKISRKSLIFTI